MKAPSLTMNTEILICEFCQKECKSKNSLIAHKVRCKQNPKRKFWNSNKGVGHRTSSLE